MLNASEVVKSTRHLMMTMMLNASDVVRRATLPSSTDDTEIHLLVNDQPVNMFTFPSSTDDAEIQLLVNDQSVSGDITRVTCQSSQNWT